jgi:hypothetical protein
MQNAYAARDDFRLFIGLIDDLCNRYGLNRSDYKHPSELFRAVVARVSIETLLFLDKEMGDDYLQDDLLGLLHRAVRSRIQEFDERGHVVCLGKTRTI